jgi:TRAP-type C4-dicarboxylate transport system permease small subunit
MEKIMRTFVMRLSNFMSVVAGIVLIFMAALTFGDIVMRYLGRPIPGVYEVVAFLGLAVAGLALPRSSLMKAHVAVDFVTEKLSGTPRLVVKIITRVLVALFFFITAWYFIGMAQSFIATRSVTMTLKLPFYPVVYVMVLSFVVQGIVSVCQIFEEEEGGADNE